MTPALPGEAPDPSATPALHALLKEVEERQMVYHDEVDVRWKAAPRLAAMLRVAVEALDGMPDADTLWDVLNVRAAALARIEAMAKGEE